jgi:hypothetical protein
LHIRSTKIDKNTAAADAAAVNVLFLLEGQAVGALIHSGVCFMGTDHNTLQGAVVCFVAVVCALSYGAFDALVGLAVHSPFLLL